MGVCVCICNLFSLYSNAFSLHFVAAVAVNFGILHDFPQFVFHDLCKHKKAVFCFIQN